MGKYYEHSGVVGITGMIVLPLAAIIGGAITGGLFGVIDAKVMFLIIKIASPLLCGALVGVTVGITGRFFKVTNNSFLVLCAVVGAAISVYACWVGYIWGVTDFKMVAKTPSQVWSAIKLLSITGVWSLKGLTPKGGLLYTFWIIEAIVTILISMPMSVLFTFDSVYCERCRKWVKKLSFGPFAIINLFDEKIKEIEKDSLKVTDLLIPAEDLSRYTTIDIYSCPKCRDCNYLSVVKETVTKDSKGKDVKNSVTLIDRLYVTGESMKKIRDNMVNKL